MRSVFSFTFSLLVLGSTLSGCTLNATIRDPQTTYDEGVVLVKRGDYRQGVAKLSQTIVKTPEFAEAYVNRGIAYAGLEKHDLAIADFTQAIELEPGIPQAYYSRGNSYAELDEVDKAIADYTQALHLNPTHAESYGNRAMLRLQQEDEAGAIADLEAAVEQFQRQNRREAAIQAYRQLKKLKPELTEPVQAESAGSESAEPKPIESETTPQPQG